MSAILCDSEDAWDESPPARYEALPFLAEVGVHLLLLAVHPVGQRHYSEGGICREKPEILLQADVPEEGYALEDQSCIARVYEPGIWTSGDQLLVGGSIDSDD